MPASREQGATIPEELIRQSDRVIEQLDCLFTILDKTRENLEGMHGIMEPFSIELTTEIDKLDSSIKAYRAKSEDIYMEVSNSLRTYATSLMSELELLSHSVNNISEAINSL